MNCELFCLYHDNVWPELYTERIDELTFVKLGEKPTSFCPKKYLDLTQFSSYRKLRPENDELEFFYNLFKAHQAGEYELPEFFGLFRSDTIPLNRERQSAFDFLDGLQQDNNVLVVFQPRMLQTLRQLRSLWNACNDDIPLLRDIKVLFSTHEQLFSSLRLPKRVSIAAHRDTWLRVFSFVIPLIEDNWNTTLEVRQDALLELSITLALAFESDLNVHCFELIDSQPPGKRRVPLDLLRSTFGKHIVRAIFLNALIKNKSMKAYLEIGCRNNSTFNAIVAPHKVGVDPQQGGTIRLTSDEFFAQNTDTFDLIFIDGLHLCEQVQRDVENALSCLSPGGVVVIHDCLPEKFEQQERNRKTRQWTGDVWKAVVALRQRKDLDIATYKEDWGLAVVLPRYNSNILIPRHQPLEWPDFVSEKQHLLRIMDYASIMEFVN